MIDLGKLKELRQMTAISIATCKKALQENDNDIEKSKIWLRKQGVKLTNSSGPVGTEGIVGVFKNESGTRFGFFDLRTQTDFVAKNEDFLSIAMKILALLQKEEATVDSIHDMKIGDLSVSEHLALLRNKLGENLTLDNVFISDLESIKKTAKIEGNKKLHICSYVHSACQGYPSFGRVAAAVVIASDLPYDKVAEIGKVLAMQIVAFSPMAINVSELDKSFIESEREVFVEEEKKSKSKKPQDLVDKIIEGKLNKSIDEKLLLTQKFIKDPKLTVGKWLAIQSKELGDEITPVYFKTSLLGK